MSDKDPVDRAQPRRVLLVADGSGADELGTGLRDLRSDWDVVRAEDGDEALARCDQARIDVIVVDMDARPAGGLELLHRIEARHPAVLRLIRCAPSDRRGVIPALRVVQQMIPRSCDPQVAANLIERLCRFRSFLVDDEIRSKLGSLHELPVRPALYLKIRLALDDPDSSAEDLAGFLGDDLALSSRVLQLANSPLFGTMHPLVTIRSAITHLGLNTLKSLILVEEIFSRAKESGLEAGFPKGFYQHALLTAKLARGILVGLGSHEEAFVAGMLHDFGALVLQATGLREEDVPSPAAGGYVLGTWGVPPLIAEAVAGHREPWRIEQAEFGVLGAVHLATLLAERMEVEGRPGVWSPLPERTLEYLQDVGVTEDLIGWREVVARIGFDLRVVRPRPAPRGVRPVRQ